MSDTPRTDAQANLTGAGGSPTWHIHADFARQLERELAEAREQRDTLAKALRKLIRLDDRMRDPDYDESGTYAGAYYCYYKGERATWDGARAALAAVKGGKA